MVITIVLYCNAMEKKIMIKLVKRIRKRVKITVEAFQNDCQFSFKLALWRSLDDILTRAHINSLATIFHKKKNEWITDYLQKLLRNIIERYKNSEFEGEYTEDAPIWICWWSGEEFAPPLVKQCLKSIRNNSGRHSVYFISKYTYKKYVSIPDFIFQKFTNGQMCTAHLSDYLRFSLLQKYGGIWLDATIFVSQTLPESYFSKSLFTCKSDIKESRYVSKYRWTPFSIGGWKGNLLFRFLKNALEEYWEHNSTAIDYLFLDYIIDIAYNTIPAIKEQIDIIPPNNLARDDLQAAMNAKLQGKVFFNVLRSDTILYKLSWRESYSMVTESGERSIYAEFLSLKF